MKEKWLKYLSECGEEKLIPIMEKFFTDKINFIELNEEVSNLDLVVFKTFEKDLIMSDLLKE